jgi:hypothetical protein
MKERVIYNNYDLWEQYADDMRDWLIDSEQYTADEITDDILCTAIYDEARAVWEDERSRLIEFFGNNGYFMLRGAVRRWNGSFGVGLIFDNFDDMFYTVTEDCDYFKMWDENGHFYLKCSHHDGTNIFEIKRINQKAVDFIENWKYSNDPRTQEEIHTAVWNSNFLSSLPHYAHTVYGCKKRG